MPRFVAALVGVTLAVTPSTSAAFSIQTRSFSIPTSHHHYVCPILSTLASTDANTADSSATSSSSKNDSPQTITSLTAHFPDLSEALVNMGISTPTPIQQSSAARALQGDNLLLVAPTGSGKTLAYLLPALTKAMREEGTILVVAPTRELAVQLVRDTEELIGQDEDGDSGVRLAVRGVDAPRLEDAATVLIGTPPEVQEALLYDGSSFLRALSAVILDEVDVLLPPAPKNLRTALDTTGGRAKTAQDERRQKEQKRKVNAAKRKGVQLDDQNNNRILSPTEQILDLIANSRLEHAPQILAGSATASRKTLDRLNQALRSASKGSAIQLLGANVQLCRPHEMETDTTGEEGEGEQSQQHTIRAVTVPLEVKHCYMELSKEAASHPEYVLNAVAQAAAKLQPATALLFLCGEFGKPKIAEKAREQAPIKGATNQARRNNQRKSATKGLYAKANAKTTTKQQQSSSGLSARNACKLLSNHGIVAQPLHVALGLEAGADETNESIEEEDNETPQIFVTFEGSARGLHLDEVDAVFVVGRPASAASYLHLAGRVGRSSPDANGNVVVRPGTVVSICTKGSAGELEKWTQQIGGLELKEMEF